MSTANRMEWMVFRYVGAVALAIALTMTAASGAAADETPTTVRAKVGDQVQIQQEPRGKKCATRQEYKRIKTKGKRGTTLRQVRRIIGSNGKRERISRANGHKWEIRRYRHCGSKIMHVYINYRDNRAYFKTGRPA
ncbi:hypothetical protein MU582_09580 [Nocardioidaceae bacterium SCSIO 66511]|nr:hypothetical protein MU582_09580 [Nocardioidaceae bacterium SCSIO 66511]